MTATEAISQVTSINNQASTDLMGHRKLKLLSPAGADSAEYEWPLVVSNKYNAASEIIETIRFVCEEFSDLQIALKNNVLQIYDPNSYDSMKLLCDKYNKVIKDTLQMCKGTSLRIPKSERPSTDLLHHIIQMCYNYSIGDPHKLNKFYEPFSPEVYGETSFQFVQQMIDTFNFKEDDVFIDLGSGVGQVVLHVAAAAKCRCIGIEKADLPAEYAQRMEARFKFWIKWFGKTYSDFELHKGDFFNDEFSEMIHSASFIFVNNFAFGPEVDHRLKSIFENLRDGAKILSSKAFCSLKFKFTHRNLGDIGAILKVKEILPVDNQSVSWTGKPVSYYLQTIDRRALEKYFESFNQTRNKNTKKKVIRGNKSNENSLNISNSSESSSDQIKDSISNNSSSPIPVTKTEAPNGLCDKTNLSKCDDPSNIEVDQTDAITKKKNNRGRPRKVAIEKIVEIKKETVNEDDSLSMDQSLLIENCEQSTNEETNGEFAPRRPGRPRKAAKKINSKRKIKGISSLNLDNLDMLHSQTVLSYSKLDDRPPPGCVEQKLTSKGENLCPVPKIILNEGVVIPGLESMDTPVSSPCSDNVAPVNNPNEVKVYDVRCIEDLMLLLQYSIQQYRNLAKSPEYVDNLKRNIEYQQNRKDDLLVEINILNRKIYDANYNNVTYAKQYLAVFGFDSIPELINDYNNMTKSIADNEAEILRLQYLISNCEKENVELHALSQQQKAEKEIGSKNASVNGDDVKNDLESFLTDGNVNSPNPNYKEMKYKKYKINDYSSSQSPLKASNKVNIDPIATADLPSEGKQNIEDSSKRIDSDVTDTITPNNTNNSTLLVQNNLERINNIIREVLNENPNKTVPTENKTASSQNGHVLHSESAIISNIPKSNQTKPAPKRTKKSKFETIKTKKDRQVILTNSAGCPSTQLVRNPMPPKEMKTDSNPANKFEEKSFSLKLKIKDNKVVNISNSLLDEYNMENGNKRKATSEDSYSNKRKAVDKNGKDVKNEMCTEPKIPPVVLKISKQKQQDNKEQYYLKNDDNTELMAFTSKKLSHRVIQSELSGSNVTAKSLEHNASPSHITTLKHSTAHLNNPGYEETFLNHKESTQSPSLSLASCRSSSVESSSISSTSKKTRKRSSRSQKVNEQQNGLMASSNLVYQNGCQSSQSSSDNFQLSSYPSALNLMNISDSTKNILNPYLHNGLNQAIDPANFVNMNNSNLKNYSDPMHHRKIKDNSKVGANNYEELNSSNKQSFEPINYQYPHQLSSCMMDKSNPTDLLNPQSGINNYSISCRYDNYFPNTSMRPSNIVEAISKKSKNEPQIHNPTHTNGYYNPNSNVIY